METHTSPVPVHAPRAPLVARAVAGAGVVAAMAALFAAPAPARADGKHPFLDDAGLAHRLADLARRHPRTARRVTITVSPRGRAVEALEIDPTGRFAPDTPVLLVHGGIHGSEWLATEMVLRLCEVLLAGPDPTLAGLRYHLVPAVNIDGFAAGQRMAFRPDGARYDPNRDFPVPGQPDAPSSPQLQAFRDWARRPGLAAVLDYHTDADCFLWPWAHRGDVAPPDVEPLAEVARDMARTIGTCAGQTARVISYRHQGTAQDWFQHFAGVPALLVEMGDTTRPGQPTAEQMLIDHERAFRVFVAWLKRRVAAAPSAVPVVRDAPVVPAALAAPAAPASPASPDAPSPDAAIAR